MLNKLITNLCFYPTSELVQHSTFPLVIENKSYASAEGGMVFSYYLSSPEILFLILKVSCALHLHGGDSFISNSHFFL